MPTISFRTLARWSARVSMALALGAFTTGCTAGEVTYSGRSIKQAAGVQYYVAFLTPNTLQRLQDIPGAQVTWQNPGWGNGVATFSLDPLGPNATSFTATPGVVNNPMILPTGDYVARLVTRVDNSSDFMSVFLSSTFTHSYPSQKTADTFTGQQAPRRTAAAASPRSRCARCRRSRATGSTTGCTDAAHFAATTYPRVNASRSGGLAA
jgi:hypothetical protein